MSGYGRVVQYISPQDRGRLERAVEPRETDVQQTKAIILKAVEGGGALDVDGLIDAIVIAAGVDPNAFREQIHPRHIGADSINAELSPLKLARVRAAAREALADLAAAGIITGYGNARDNVQVHVHGGGYGTSVQLTVPEAALAQAYRVTRRYRGQPELSILDPTLATDRKMNRSVGRLGSVRNR